MSIHPGLLPKWVTLVACLVLGPQALGKTSLETRDESQFGIVNELSEANKAGSTAPGQNNGIGDWTVVVRPQQPDGTTMVHVVLASQIHALKGDEKKKVVLQTLCKQGETHMFFAYPFNIATRRVQVTYQIDDRRLQTVWLRPTADHKGFGWCYGRASIPFAKTLFDKSKLMVWVTADGRGRVRADFKVARLRAAIQTLRETCKW